MAVNGGDCNVYALLVVNAPIIRLYTLTFWVPETHTSNECSQSKLFWSCLCTHCCKCANCKTIYPHFLSPRDTYIYQTNVHSPSCFDHGWNPDTSNLRPVLKIKKKKVASLCYIYPLSMFCKKLKTLWFTAGGWGKCLQHNLHTMTNQKYVMISSQLYSQNFYIQNMVWYMA